MAEKNTDIFKSLKSYQVKPPKNCFKKIWQALQQRQHTMPEQNYLAIPLKENQPINADENYSANDIAIFRSLQQYTISPPAFGSLNITDVATEKKNTGKIFSINYFGRVAAAIVFILFCGWGVYHFTQTKKDIAPVAVNKIATENNTANTAVNNNVDKSTPVNKDVKPVSHNAALIAKVTKSRPAGSKNNSADHIAYHSYNKKVKLIDNDFVLTLVSYKYSDYAPLLAKIKRNKKLKLDQFSYINISDKMNDMLKKMYATKRSNRPTRKARKLKAKLGKWKRADEKHFDTNAGNDPMDIIDLSEFILN